MGIAIALIFVHRRIHVGNLGHVALRLGERAMFSKLTVLIESRSARLRAFGHDVRLRGLADHGCCTLL
jgi:hypothetical protein